METEYGESHRVADLADRLLGKVEQAIGELDIQVTSRKVKTRQDGTEETREFLEAQRGTIVDRAGLKLLTSVLKELQTITGSVTELERREREAKIESLRRGAGIQETEEGDTGVILLPAREMERQN